MSEHAEESGPAGESLMEKITEKFHGHDSSSSSDSEGEKPEASSSTVKAKIWRLFGREKPIHGVFGGGKAADAFLWRNKKVTAGVLGVATAIWVLFELLEYHLLTLLCHILIVCLVIVFLWANATKFISKTTPHIPELKIPEDFVVDAALGLRLEILCAASLLRNIASGRDLQKFLAVIAGLWVLSIVGKWCNFLTLFYIVFVLLHTIPLIYEKYEDKIDAFGEKAMIEIKKQYAVFEVKVLSKIPRGPLKSKKP